VGKRGSENSVDYRGGEAVLREGTSQVDKRKGGREISGSQAYWIGRKRRGGRLPLRGGEVLRDGVFESLAIDGDPEWQGRGGTVVAHEKSEEERAEKRRRKKELRGSIGATKPQEPQGSKKKRKKRGVQLQDKD